MLELSESFRKIIPAPFILDNTKKAILLQLVHCSVATFRSQYLFQQWQKNDSNNHHEEEIINFE